MTPSEPVAASTAQAQQSLGAGRERRLHPLSWLFVLLDQLRQFAFPLIALLFFGRSGGDAWQLFGVVGMAVLTGLAVLRYFTYRFRVEAGELVVRSGLLHRNVRRIPLARIQNVALKRNLLHRAFGVAEVQLESAVSGATAEAQMRVLSMRDAHALELLVRAEAGADPDAPDADAEPERGALLLALPTGELVKLGITSNRGLLIGAAGLGIFSQLDSEGVGDLLADVVQALFGYARDLDLPWTQWLLASAALALGLIAVMRTLSVLLVVLQFHGFRLHQREQRLSVEGGLLTRVRQNAPLHKIQHWTLREGILHRFFARRSLQVETAVMQAANDARGLSDIVPIAPPALIDSLLQRWLPWLQLDGLDWQPLHPRAWRRLLFWPALWTVIAVCLLCLRFGSTGLVLLLLLPWLIFRARRLATACGWILTDRVLMFRSGWLDRSVSFAEVGKLQGVQLLSSPFDRRHGMASVVADTAGANPLRGHRLEIRFLPADVAQELYSHLCSAVSRSRLRW